MKKILGVVLLCMTGFGFAQESAIVYKGRDFFPTQVGFERVYMGSGRFFPDFYSVKAISANEIILNTRKQNLQLKIVFDKKMIFLDQKEVMDMMKPDGTPFTYSAQFQLLPIQFKIGDQWKDGDWTYTIDGFEPTVTLGTKTFSTVVTVVSSNSRFPGKDMIFWEVYAKGQGLIGSGKGSKSSQVAN